MLVEAGGDINIRSKSHQAPLDIAKRKCHLMIVSYLTEKGSSAGVMSDPYYEKLLLTAASEDNLELVKFFIIKKGVNPRAADANGWTALHFSTTSGNLKICELLLSHKAINVNIMTMEGLTCLHCLVKTNNIPPPQQIDSYLNILKLMLDQGANINAQDKNLGKGEAPIHLAVCVGNEAAFQFLVKHNADLNVVNLVGDTPLHYAVSSGSSNMVRILIEGGADPNIGSPADGTPKELALKKKRPDIAQYLEAKTLQKSLSKSKSTLKLNTPPPKPIEKLE